MHLESFIASVQYNDHKGTAAADDADVSASSWLAAKGLSQDGEFLAGIDIYFSVPGLDGLHVANVTFLLAPHTNYDELQKTLESGSVPLVVRKVEQELSLEEFFSLFKRFNICLSGLGELTGKSVTFHNYD